MNLNFLLLLNIRVFFQVAGTPLQLESKKSVLMISLLSSQGCRNRGVQGMPLAPPIFGSSVNPIPNGGWQIMPTNYYWHPQIFSSSGIPAISYLFLQIRYALLLEVSPQILQIVVHTSFAITKRFLHSDVPLDYIGTTRSRLATLFSRQDANKVRYIDTCYLSSIFEVSFVNQFKQGQRSWIGRAAHVPQILVDYLNQNGKILPQKSKVFAIYILVSITELVENIADIYVSK